MNNIAKGAAINKIKLESAMAQYKDEGFEKYSDTPRSRLLCKGDDSYRLVATNGSYWEFEIPENSLSIEEAYKLLNRITIIYCQNNIVKEDISSLHLAIDMSKKQIRDPKEI